MKLFTNIAFLALVCSVAVAGSMVGAQASDDQANPPPPQLSDDDLTADQLYHDTPLHFIITRGDGQVKLEWTRNYGVNNQVVSDWVLYIKDDRGFFPVDTIKIYKNPVNAVNNIREPDARQDYTFYNLTNGVQYEFRVVGNQFTNKEVISDTIKATPMTFPGASPSFLGLPLDGGVILSWSAPDDDGGSQITEYVIAARIGTVNPFDTVATIKGHPDTYTVENLTNGVPYEFVVIARNGVGDGPPSDSITLTPTGEPYCIFFCN